MQGALKWLDRMVGDRRDNVNLSRFLRNESGSLTVESVIIFPLVVIGLMMYFTYYEAYQRRTHVLKANYAIADYLSRVSSIDATVVNGLDDLFEYMTRTGEDSWVRITLVECEDECGDENQRVLQCIMSKTSSAAAGLHTNATVRQNLASKIPIMYEGQQLIVVETAARFIPTFGENNWANFAPGNITDTTVTSPREYTTIFWNGVEQTSCGGGG